MATFVEEKFLSGGGGDGLGLGGGGALGLIALLALLGRGNNGLFGNGDGGGVAGLNNLQGAIDTNAMMTQLADIKASIPYNEAQVQLALATAVSGLTAQNTANTQYLSQGQTAIQLAQQATAASLSREISAVDTNVDRQSTAIQVAIKDDGEKTRALITSNQIADLQRQLGVAQLTALEDRQNAARTNDRIHIETTVNQNQNQMQLQAQAQNNAINRLLDCVLENTQLARATNQQLIIGNTGAVTGGALNANPTNVRA